MTVHLEYFKADIINSLYPLISFMCMYDSYSRITHVIFFSCRARRAEGRGSTSKSRTQSWQTEFCRSECDSLMRRFARKGFSDERCLDFPPNSFYNQVLSSQDFASEYLSRKSTNLFKDFRRQTFCLKSTHYDWNIGIVGFRTTPIISMKLSANCFWKVI